MHCIQAAVRCAMQVQWEKKREEAAAQLRELEVALGFDSTS